MKSCRLPEQIAVAEHGPSLRHWQLEPCAWLLGPVRGRLAPAMCRAWHLRCSRVPDGRACYTRRRHLPCLRSWPWGGRPVSSGKDGQCTACIPLAGLVNRGRPARPSCLHGHHTRPRSGSLPFDVPGRRSQPARLPWVVRERPSCRGWQERQGEREKERHPGGRSTEDSAGGHVSEGPTFEYSLRQSVSPSARAHPRMSSALQDR